MGALQYPQTDRRLQPPCKITQHGQRILQYPQTDRRLCNSMHSGTISTLALTYMILKRIVASATAGNTVEEGHEDSYSILKRIVASATSMQNHSTRTTHLTVSSNGSSPLQQHAFWNDFYFGLELTVSSNGSSPLQPVNPPNETTNNLKLQYPQTDRLLGNSLMTAITIIILTLTVSSNGSTSRQHT